MSGLKGMILIMLNEKGIDDEISCPGNLPRWRIEIILCIFSSIYWSDNTWDSLHHCPHVYLPLIHTAHYTLRIQLCHITADTLAHTHCLQQ